jgi:S-adenosylmethionine:tRNA ribosyltransferase-isomerase
MECLLLEQEDDAHWQALVHPGQKLKPGARFVVMDEARAPGVEIRGEICDRLLFGRRRVRMSVTGASLDAAIDQLGHVPLPPYIARPDTAADHERYHTIYARARGSIAAPTAGLHFDAKTLAALDAAGVGRTAVTLHVGYGTFKPIRVDDVAAHQVDPERYEISHDAVRAIEATRAAGRRVVAVGTTTTRALEHAARRTGQVHAGSGEADLFIRPGHTFRVVDALLTNFHLPRSSLLVLVCALAGREFVLAAYRDAVARGFRFYSYGDAMLVV